MPPSAAGKPVSTGRRLMPVSRWLRVCKASPDPRHLRPLLASGGDAGPHARRQGGAPCRGRRCSCDCPLLRRRDVGRAALLDRLAFGDRGRLSLLWAGPVPVPREPRCGRARPARGPHRLGRPDDVVVDRARPLLGGVRPAARLLRVRAARPARLPASRGRRGPSPPGSPCSRSRARVGAARQGDPLALPRRRARRAPAQPGRLLELARARRRDRGAARPLGAPARRHRARRAPPEPSSSTSPSSSSS